MNIAITGYMGLIGSTLKSRLKEEGHEIVLEIDLRNGKNIFDLKDMKCDFEIDLMIHAAAHCKINESISNPQKTFENNVSGTFSVFEFCRKNNIKKIVYFSSSRVLSKDRNPYTASKIYGEELCRGYKDAYGINYIILRPSTVYGPFWDESKRLVHIFITNALMGKNLEIYGDPKTKTLDFTYVDDFVDATMLALEKGWGGDFDISGGEESNIYDLARFIIDEIDSESKITIGSEELAQPQKICLDVSDIKKLGYSPKIELSQGIRKTIDFYKKLELLEFVN